MRIGNYLKMSAALVLAIFLTACASKVMDVANPGSAMDLNQKVKSGAYVQKVDNFLMILDASSSMSAAYIPFDTAPDKFTVARDIAKLLNQTIPDIKLEAGLRTFGPEATKSSLIYGMTAYTKDGMGKAIDSVKKVDGLTPMSKALTAAIGDLEKTSGKIAVIVISDGENNIGDAVAAAKSLKEKYGDRICIYTILVGEDEAGRKTMSDVAQAGGCGFATDTPAVSSAAGMADFVEKVFLTPAPMAAAPAPAPVAAPAPAPMKASETVSVTLQVNFDFDKAVVKPMYHDHLQLVADFLKTYPNITAEINGHTCSIGTDAYNMKLSQARANSVRKYLIDKFAIAPARLKAQGFGESQPLVSNDTNEGREQNRRVMGIFTATK